MLDRKTAPKHAEINSFRLPHPEINQLSNEVPLLVLKGVTQQVLKIELVFNAAKWIESKRGLSYFTAHMLEKGTATKTSFEIADFFDRHGASVEISTGLDFVSLSLFSLTKNITKVLPLFLELVSSSVFPEDELKLQKDIFNQSLKINNEKTSYVASKLIRQHLFGNSHPYGSTIEENDVNQLTREDLSSFFKDHFSLIQTFVVGSLDEHLLKFIISQLSMLPGGMDKRNALHFSVSPNESPEYLEKPGSVQSSLRLGKRSINRNHQDYPALVLINHIFGGYFGSRLMKNIREDKGLTYGIHSSLNNLKNDAFFMIGADVNRINKDVAILEIKNELRRLCDKPVSTQEIQNSKNHLLGSLQLEIANPFSVIEKIKTIHLYGLDENFYNNLFLNIHELNESILQRVAIDYLADNIIEIAVG
jgi:zinc protease